LSYATIDYPACRSESTSEKPGNRKLKGGMIMKTAGSMEVVSFKMVPGTAQEDALGGIRTLDEFYKDKPGFQGMQAALGDDGTWMLVLNWDCAESEKSASAAMMASDKTGSFKKTIIPQTVTKKIYPCYR
jgi:hypothetical protein